MESPTIACTDEEWPPVIAVDGVLNARTAGPCLERVRERAAGSFVLDLSRVYVCDPAGATALVDLNARLLRQGCRCVLAAPSYIVARVLRITGLARMVSICSTSAKARRLLRGGAVVSGRNRRLEPGAR